ncbi:glycosyltransferase family 4 protein [Rosettibacter firmus]|uniref:glycosyltransferase family 4 protein n=1 Tax=Rosettibacter firmus TaxID=3111522 RepID=UPI00336BC186
MKILKTCLSKSWGGLEMYALQTVKQLIKHGVNAELLCYPDSRIYSEAISEGITTHTSKFNGYFHPFEIIKTSSLLKNNYDIIHCGASKDLWLIVPSLQLANMNTPLILSKQMGSYIIKKDFLHKWIYKRLDYALAISSVIAKNLEETTPLTKNKILLLHNAIDTEKFNPELINSTLVRKEFSIYDDEILIGMMARFSPGKGHEEFLYAANDLIKKYDKIKFMIVGEASKGEEEYEKEIKILAKRLGLNNKLIFTGFRKDTPEVLAAMDIFVFPSHAEAFGIALAEALSMGKPSVCSNSDGVLDIAVDGETSLLFEKQNWKDLSNKIEKLILNPDLRIKFGKAARNRAIKLFDLEVFTKKLIDIYKRTIEERSNRK